MNVLYVRMPITMMLLIVLPLAVQGCQANIPEDPDPEPESQQIIADHTVVDAYDKIPQAWIDEIKKMWFDLPGMSHSLGYRIGLQLLEDQDAKFAVSVLESGVPEGPTTANLRASSATYGNFANSNGWQYWSGEQDWFTNETAVARIKAHLYQAHEVVHIPIAAMGFGWCWDMIAGDTGDEDSVYGVQWEGSSEEGPDGSLAWGLDVDDYDLTGNRVCMDTYLDVTEQYSVYCAVQGYTTKVFYTTGPVDSGGFNGRAQRQVKHDYIRNYVAAEASRILFDYADILAWSDAGTESTETWNGHVYQVIHPDNMLDLGGGYTGDDHIGEVGALRLGKAVWWMLARIAGWDGTE